MQNIKLSNVRLSFPSLFKRSIFDNKEGKYEATFILDKKDVDTKAIIDNIIKQLLTENKIKVRPDMMAIKDGAEVNSKLNDYWLIKASNHRRPTVINKDKTPIVEEDDIIYAGCYVNAIINFWVQDNKFGKRINANLMGIQFVKDGEAFGPGNVDVTDEFDEFDELDKFNVIINDL